MSEELKPCPFCGSEARFEVDGERGWICCSNEDCSAWDTEIFATTQEAIKAWNMRTERTCYYIEEVCDIPTFFCSKCGIVQDYVPKFCPECGAKVMGTKKEVMD